MLNKKKSDRLRSRAEELLAKRSADEYEKLTDENTKRLIHELRVHQIELEMQNEDLRCAQGELEQSRTDYADLYDFSPVGYFSFDKNGLIERANLTGAGLLGIERALLIKKPFHKYVEKAYQDRFFLHRKQVVDTGKRHTCEIKIKVHTGRDFYAQLESTAVKDREGKFRECRTVITDISDRKRIIEELTESENRFRTLFEQVAVGVAQIVSETGRFVIINQRYCDIVGYSRSEMERMNFQEITHPEDLQADLDNMQLLIKGAIRDFTMEKRYFHKNGSIVWVNLAVSPMWRAGEKPDYHIAVVEDITVRKLAEEELRKAKAELEIMVKERTAELEATVARLKEEIIQRKRTDKHLQSTLKEKEVLLHELHHRVKNNMQVISSLLNIQSAHIHDKDALQSFRESQNRIRAMSLVHEKLYMSKDMSKINFINYIETIASNLFKFYGVNEKRVRLNIAGDKVFLKIDTAIPCGLIINELISNALKYAFPDNREGEISVTLHPVSEDRYELTVSDNGIGLPDETDLKKRKSLGLKLVEILTAQIGGAMKRIRGNGTAFCITFNKRKHKKEAGNG